MSSYTPGRGVKKPLNMLENPIYPDIKKGPPRFVCSRKHWDVDTGATLMNTEPYTQFYENAVLSQSRDYNKTVYGQSSHKDIVNAVFRPPLLDPYEDIHPLTRIPATTQAIIPHINPSTAGHDAGTSSYTAKNQRPSDIEGALTDRIKAGEWRPTFFAPVENPRDNSVLPDLEAKLPSASVHAGWNFPIYISPQPSEDIELEEKLDVPLHTRPLPPITLGATQFDKHSLHNKMPNYSVGAGGNVPININTEIPVEGYTLGNNRPEVSAGAGVNNPLEINSKVPEIELSLNRPQVSAGAGMNNPLEINSKVPDIELDKISCVDPFVQTPNPGSDEGYMERIGSYFKPQDYTQEKNPSYSYHVTPSYDYRTRNEHKNLDFRTKLQPLKSYGNITQSQGAIPRPGIGVPINTPFKNKKAKYHI